MPQSYDVFLSYRGEDTGKNFTDHLYTALVQAGIHTFIIDERVIGENVAAKIQEAIEISKISIIVFSKHYGSSSWCLDELVEIMERRNTVGHTVVPVFYHVDPSAVRKQTGSFAEAFYSHKKRFQWDMDRVERWRIALKEAADMAGMALMKGYESLFVQDIVQEIGYKLNRTVLNVFEEMKAKFNGNTNYDVCLSFRVADTGTNFTDHLYTALVQARIHTFRDETYGRVELQKEIEESKISIIVFSENYGHSRQCLDELVMIMERKGTVDHIVVPIFYHVNPSSVRQQTGSFAEAFARHEMQFREERDKVVRWRHALREAADLQGMVLEDRLESQFVKNIVGVIRNKLNQQTVFNVNTEPVYNLSLKQKFRQSITSWQKGAHLGSGAFGIVYEGFTDDGFLFAVKEASLLAQEGRGKKGIFQLEQEISLLSQFEHENIVQYFGTDKDDAKLYIFLELVPNGSLETLYKKFELRDSQVSLYTRQILSGLKYLHEQNVVHRDIKCANILVDARRSVDGQRSVKLADFGLAKITTMNDIKSSNGSPFWMAPEVVDTRKGAYGVAADIWSLGCTVLEMLIRKPPYHDMEPFQAMFKIGKGEPPHIPNSLSNDAKDFILQCIQVDPNDRPTASQLLEHPFVNRPL